MIYTYLYVNYIHLGFVGIIKNCYNTLSSGCILHFVVPVCLLTYLLQYTPQDCRKALKSEGEEAYRVDLYGKNLGDQGPSVPPGSYAYALYE